MGPGPADEVFRSLTVWFSTEESSVAHDIFIDLLHHDVGGETVLLAIRSTRDGVSLLLPANSNHLTLERPLGKHLCLFAGRPTPGKHASCGC